MGDAPRHLTHELVLLRLGHLAEHLLTTFVGFFGFESCPTLGFRGGAELVERGAESTDDDDDADHEHRRERHVRREHPDQIHGLAQVR